MGQDGIAVAVVAVVAVVAAVVVPGSAGLGTAARACCTGGGAADPG